MASTEVQYSNSEYAARKNTESNYTCSICNRNFQEPKLLPCFHTFCKIPCLERLVVQGPEGQSLTCPTCQYKIPLPDNGVAGLQTNFQVEIALKGKQTLKRGRKTDCENCKKMPAYKYCQQCKKFMCEKCIDTHQMWGDFSGHKLLDVDSVKTNPSKSTSFLKCDDHPSQEAKLYCETCSELICNQCTILSHRGHNYSLSSAVFFKHKQELVSCLKPVKENLDKAQQALGAFDSLAREINEQRATIEADIHREVDQIQQQLDERRVELVASLDSYTQQKLRQIEMHREHVKKTCAKMSSCLEYAEAGLETGSEGEVLKMKGPVLKRIEEIAIEFDPDTIPPKTKADIHWMPNNQASQACKEFGDVVCDSIDNEMIYDNLDFEVSSNTAYQVVSIGDKPRQGSITEKSTDKCYRVASSNYYHVPVGSGGNLKRQSNISENPRDEKASNPTYSVPVPPKRRQGSLREKPTGNRSNFAVAPNVAYQVPVPSRDSTKKHGSISEKPSGERASSSVKKVPVPPRRHHSLPVEDQSVCTAASSPVYQVPTVNRGSIKGCTSSNERPTDISSHYATPKNAAYSVPTGIGSLRRGGSISETPADSSHSKALPSPTSEILRKPVRVLKDLNQPFGVTTNNSSDIIVVDSGKHRVFVIDSDGEEIFFGKQGTKKGQFKKPCGVAADHVENIYVVDSNNHRIQKFSPEGKCITFVGGLGNGRLQFAHPIGICFNETNHLLYVCDQANNRIQVLSTNLTFMRSFGTPGDGDGELNYPKHIAFDQSNNLYVTDCGNNRVQVFTTDGQFVRAFSNKADGLTLEKPFAIAVDSNNTVYVSELSKHCVNIFTSLGEYISTFGGNGSEEGLFRDIGCLCVFGTSLIVADSSNNRLQMF